MWKRLSYARLLQISKVRMPNYHIVSCPYLTTPFFINYWCTILHPLWDYYCWMQNPNCFPLLHLFIINCAILFFSTKEGKMTFVKKLLNEIFNFF